MTVRLTRRLTLEARSAEGDGAGGRVETWGERATIWAEMRAISARERGIGGRPGAFVTHRAFVRHAAPGSPDRPEPDQRLRDGERVYAILAVSEADDRRGFLTLWLEEGALS